MSKNKEDSESLIPSKVKKKRGGPEPKARAKIVLAALDEFRETPNIKGQTLARIIYERNPYIFENVEKVRPRIKYYAKQRKDPKYLEPHIDSSPYVIPEGVDYNQAVPFVMPKKNDNVLLLCDMHSPFHDERAIAKAFDHGIRENVNTIMILGDAFDYHAYSAYPEDPRKRNPIFEYHTNIELLESIRKAFPDIDIFFKLGNHEIWWQRYLWTQAPILTGQTFTEFWNVYEFERLGIKYIGDKSEIRFGKITGIHGHEIRGGSGVNPARKLFLTYVDNVFCGHFHRTSHHSEPTGRGKVIGTWSIGGLLKLKPQYMPINKWNQGFAHLRWDKDEFEFRNYKIIEGKVKGE